MPQRIEKLCAEKGVRMTHQRRIIARALSEASDHPDVAELHRRVNQIDPHISIATLYRTLKLFEDTNVIERYDFGDGKARYEEAPEEHHDHLIDLETGSVVEFRNDEIERLQAEVARRLGYNLTGHRLELYCVKLDKTDDAEP